MTDSLAEKNRRLEEIIQPMGRVAVACSGGVDSTFLLQTAHDILGHSNVIALFADTPLMPPGENRDIEDLVNHVGCRLLTVKLDPLAWPEFTANPQDRCYLCKKKIYITFLEKLSDLDISVLMDGTNLDDLDDYRPGLQALEELGVVTPLADAGLTKQEIRQLSRQKNLPNWNKPSSSCLATRIATDETINQKKLNIVAKCEAELHRLDFFGCRVRLRDDYAIIELAEGDFERFAEPQNRQTVTDFFNNFNIKKVYADARTRPPVEP